MCPWKNGLKLKKQTHIENLFQFYSFEYEKNVSPSLNEIDYIEFERYFTENTLWESLVIRKYSNRTDNTLT